MSIRNFDDIHSIRKEIRKIYNDIKQEEPLFASLKRLILFSKNKEIKAASFKTREDISTLPKEKTTKVEHASLDNLSKMLENRYDRQELAEHIYFLLKNHFNDEDGAVVKKLTELSQQLVKDTKESVHKADNVLNEQGTKIAPSDFKRIVSDLSQTLQGEFDLPSAPPIKYYASVDKAQNGDRSSNRLYNIAYIAVKGFKGNDQIRDIWVVVTRRSGGAGASQDFIRTFTSYVNPSALIKTNIGNQFDTTKRAFDLLMTSLKLDKLIDVIHPSQIPVKKEQLKLNHKDIYKQTIDADNGVVTIYLNSSITTLQDAEKALKDIFVETKNIIKSIHPRNRNPIKSTIPKPIIMVDKNKNREKHFKFKLIFSKPENGKALELPRNKIAEFMKIMDINHPESAQEFNKLLKRFVGVQ